MLAAVVELQRDRAAFGDAQRRLEALGQPLLHFRPRAQAVDHHVDVVLLGLLQRRQLGGLDDAPLSAGRADAKAHEALRLHLREQVDEFALAVAHHRRQHHQPRVQRQRERGVDHLADVLRLQRQPVVGTERRAGAREQQAQVVVHLGDRAHRGARVVRARLLLDADRRRQALDQVDVGLVHQLQELPRVRRQALDVAALALGVQRVEGEARLARARQTGDHHQRPLGDVEVDVLQVVCAGTADVKRPRRQGLHVRRPWRR